MEDEQLSRSRSRQARLAAVRKKRRKRNIIIGCSTCAVVVIVVLLLVLIPGGAKKAKATRPRAAAEGQAPKVEETSPAATSAQPPESSAVTSSPPASVPVQATSPPPPPAPPPLVAPMDGNPLYPYTKAESIACGKWRSGSTDYPYFGAPREGTRLHAGIDVYPAAGAGAPVKALKDGKVIKVALFYTRATGEKTYGVLIDHGDFVANYAEVQPSVNVGDAVRQGQVVGAVSGTKQLHFELYRPGTVGWLQWYGNQPGNLVDPTDKMIKLVGN